MPLTLDDIRERREEILEIARRHGAYNVRVFGSTVRGTASEESDVDFLVSLEPGRSLLDQAGLMIELQDLLDRPVDVVLDRALRSHLRDEVLERAVDL